MSSLAEPLAHASAAVEEALAVEDALAASLANVESAKEHIHLLLDARAAASRAEIAELRRERDDARARAAIAEARVAELEALLSARALEADSDMVDLRKEIRQLRAEALASSLAARESEHEAVAASAERRSLHETELSALVEAKQALLSEALECAAECQKMVIACRQSGELPAFVPRIGRTKTARAEFKRVMAALQPDEQLLILSRLALDGSQSVPIPVSATPELHRRFGSDADVSPLARSDSHVLGLGSGALVRSPSRARRESIGERGLSRSPSSPSPKRDARTLLWWQFGEPPTQASSSPPRPN